MKKRPPSSRRRFVLTNGVAVGAILLFLLLDRLDLFDRFLFCPWHLTGLYCPTCGLTRASHALLALDIRAALRYNPLIFPLLAVIAYYEWYAALAAVRRREPLLGGASRWPMTLLLIAFGVFFLVRNALLLFGIDPLGDFIK